MANIVRNFVQGRMNKSLDERLVPNGEYIDAKNIRLGSTEASEIGSVENSKGNSSLTELRFIDVTDTYEGTPLSASARCIGSYADGESETIYWFVHDPLYTASGTGGTIDNPTNKLDLIVSYDVLNDSLIYHVISINDGSGSSTTLNFNPDYLITGVDLVDDLLFFTDDYNAPRRINVNVDYGNPLVVSGVYIDQFTEESLLVIKKPPINSPSITPFDAAGEENFLEDRFICFAYRYKYEDNEYSATSQFSSPSFLPGGYDLSTESYLNEGMINTANSCAIDFNTGGPLVVGIDLLFKEMNSSVIKVIEKFNKADEGWADNQTQTFNFTNNKIFTLLPSSEILRLYDNVPRFAKAQTIMGNRLVYGNYVDGYDLIDQNGYPVKLDYETSLVSKAINSIDLTGVSTTSSGDYSVDPNLTSINKSNVKLNVDLTSVSSLLKSGSSLTFDITFTHNGFTDGSGASISGKAETTPTPISFNYLLQQDFATVANLFASTDFQEKIGTATSILPVYAASGDTSCDGNTFTDVFNCAVPSTLAGGTPNPSYKFSSGISALEQGIETTLSGNTISLQIPAMRFVDNQSGPSSNLDVYEYYSISINEVEFREVGNPTSLHSNRDYEVGIVYMDDFNRASTALVSTHNTIHVGCSDSASQNYIRTTIPSQQLPPAFATRYKFAIKPDQENYETVYSSIFFTADNTNDTYFLLQGENAQKVENGDRLIVKRDVDGPVSTCEYVTVLEKKAQEEDFITVAGVTVPSGVYMKISSSSVNTVSGDDTYFTGTPSLETTIENNSGEFPLQEYKGFNTSIQVPSGSIIKFTQKFDRKGKNNSCPKRKYVLEKTYVSSQDYLTIPEWFEGDNIASTLNDGVQEAGDENPPNLTFSYNGITYTDAGNYGLDTSQPGGTNYLCTWYINNATNELWWISTGVNACGSSDKKQSRIRCKWEIYQSEDTLIFETEPSDALPDVWYESNLSYPITGGFHSGGGIVQDQSNTLPAIIDLDFFNCIAFGNGVESYKIRDSIIGRAISLGNRVTSVSAQDYKMADRFSDLTYSGVFNNEANVNKLNEFNLGLLNFKPLEESFGPIEKLFARKTDILTLQEDKISYVLAGKNLLSDSTGGGTIASVPEVLGNQISRVEDFGISNNPESFAEWGPHKYFTDAKRGAVIHLVGDGPSERLEVISESGMRSWFRDLFISSFNTQKIGGFDPYMNEYVLSSNTQSLPETAACSRCGITQRLIVPEGGLDLCFDLGELVGDVNVTYTVFQIGATTTFDISSTYNTVTTTPVNNANSSGSFIVDKNSVAATQLDLNIVPTGGSFSVGITVDCPEEQPLTIVLVSATTLTDAGKFITNQYRWTDDAGAFTSALHSELVEFSSVQDSPIVSQYSVITGAQGANVIPSDSATVRIISNKIGSNDYVFDTTTDSFKYLRSATEYTSSEVNLLLADASLATATPIDETLSPSQYSATFNMPAAIPSVNNFLYLVWDYTKVTEAALCFGAKVEDACCDCACGTGACTAYSLSNGGSGSAVIQYTDCSAGSTEYITLGGFSSSTICSRDVPLVTSGAPANISILVTECDCS